MNTLFKKDRTILNIIYINVFFFIVIQAFMTYNKLTLPIKDDTKNKNHELVQIIKNEYHIIQTPFGKYDINEKLAAPSNMIEISNRPWLIITHIFTHIEYMHFIVNMFFLYFFGKITSIFMNKKITTLYVGGGLSGYLFFVLASNIFPAMENGMIIGASGAIFSIMLAAAIIDPKYKISIPLIKKTNTMTLVTLYIILSFILIKTTSNPGGNISHIGGALFGGLYALALKRKNKNTKTTREMSDDEWRSNKKTKEKKLNEILEKISKSGFESLTLNEKKFLEEEN